MSAAYDVMVNAEFSVCSASPEKPWLIAVKASITSAVMVDTSLFFISRPPIIIGYFEYTTFYNYFL
jgi:hypothetical protein